MEQKRELSLFLLGMDRSEIIHLFLQVPYSYLCPNRSVLKASLMSEEKLAVLLSVFGSLKQKVLWKWETDTMKNKPENVMLYKWLPQQDILGHPKVKMFVSHGGQSSFQETLCHQKPAVSYNLKLDVAQENGFH